VTSKPNASRQNATAGTLSGTLSLKNASLIPAMRQLYRAARRNASLPRGIQAP
jgi:hypothetical protein